MKLTRNEFDELCCKGQLHYNYYDIYMIHWQTYYKGIAVMMSSDNKATIIQLEVEKGEK